MSSVGGLPQAEEWGGRVDSLGDSGLQVSNILLYELKTKHD